MMLDLTDDETCVLVIHLKHAIEFDPSPTHRGSTSWRRSWRSWNRRPSPPNRSPRCGRQAIARAVSAHPESASADGEVGMWRPDDARRPGEPLRRSPLRRAARAAAEWFSPERHACHKLALQHAPSCCVLLEIGNATCKW